VSERTVTLIGVDGTRHVLACSAEPYQVKANAQLWGTAPYRHITRQIAQIPGERVESAQALPRTIVVPVLVEGASELEVDARLGALGAMLSPHDDARLIYRRPDGVERELAVRYVGGGDAITATDDSGYLQRYVTVPLLFRAHWPFWRSATAAVSSLGPTSFSDGRSSGSNLATATNAGDVDCWPEITVTGYAEAIEIASLTLGKVVRVRRILALTDVLRIDTDPRSFGVYINDAADYTAIDPLTEWFPLVPGPNVLLFRGNTATGTETIGTFRLRWREQFETP
jgi:Phage tail protein